MRERHNGGRGWQSGWRIGLAVLALLLAELPNGFQVGAAAAADASNATDWTAVRAKPATAALAIASGNGARHPNAGVGFPVVGGGRKADGTIRNVTVSTEVRLGVKTGGGSLGGTLTGTIAAGTGRVVITGATYTKAEGGVALTVTRTSGDALAPGNC